MFPSEHEFAALVMDRGPSRYLAAISLRGESNNLKGGIERVSGMYFLEKLAGRLGKRDEHVSDVLRKERCPGSREREYLQAVHYRGCVSVTPRVFHVVVNRMIVSRNGLEGRSVRIGECAAWCAEDFANAQVFKRSRAYNGEVAGVKGWARFPVGLLANSCCHQFHRCSSKSGLSLVLCQLLRPGLWLLQLLHRQRRDRQLDPSRCLELVDMTLGSLARPGKPLARKFGRRFALGIQSFASLLQMPVMVLRRAISI